MDRASIYILQNNEGNTFEYDDKLPALPLPELHETLERYYKTLIPFGTEEELSNSRRIIEEFQNGIGKRLHAKLKERSIQMKNWLGDWWNTYAYHSLRMPLYPYTIMVMPFKLELLHIPATKEYALKNLSRILYHTLEFWDLLRTSRLKPLSSHGGQVKYSSNLYRNFFSTTRIPGQEIDHIESHFKTHEEGKTPSHIVIIGKGRIFMFNGIRDDINDEILTAKDLLIVLQRIRSTIDSGKIGECVSILTHDDRTSWAKNRQHLRELSVQNKQTLELIESSSVIIILDENEPNDYEEVSRLAISGDYHSLWADRSSIFIAFKNGKFACIGEHSCYDGTISVSFATFLQLSLLEAHEPSWSNDDAKLNYVNFEELNFDLDDHLQAEIIRVEEDSKKRRQDVLVTHEIFHDYGKDFMKNCKLHPDSFIQVVMQIAYAEMHNEIAPTYETALMRHYYNGRTETLRSCTTEVHKLLKMVLSFQRQSQSPTNCTSFSSAQLIQAFRTAVQHHNQMMNEARKGYGVDRHLFGLWCVAHLNGIKMPSLFTDPLYIKSGGGGNFVLSTSTLGYTMNVGYVAPMLLDGYGVFYTTTSQCVFMQVSAYRDSSKTSAHKFNQQIFDTLRRIKKLMDKNPEQSNL